MKITELHRIERLIFDSLEELRENIRRELEIES